MKDGDKLDAIKVDQQGIKCWANAFVKETIEDTKIKIKFEFDTYHSERTVSRFSPEIAKLGEQTQGHREFRESLKIGDRVDCYDSSTSWYAATILGLETREFQDELIPMAHIAFRIYDISGDKVDEKGNKFFGWESTFDEWIPLYSARITEYQKYTKGEMDSVAAEKKNEEVKVVVDASDLVDDGLDD